MLESLYERSMRAGTDRRAVRYLLGALLVAAALFAAVLAIPIDQVMELSGEVVPASTARIVAPGDGWVCLDRSLEGRRVAQGQPLGRWTRREASCRDLDRDLDGDLDNSEVRRLVAPVSGVVLAAPLGSGQPSFARAGQLVAELFRDEDLVVRATLPADPALPLDRVAQVALEPAGGERRGARVLRSFYRRAGEGGESLETAVDLAPVGGPPLRPGARHRVHLIGEPRPLGRLLGDIFLR